MWQRLLLALTWAFVLSFSFRRSWRREEDKAYAEKSENKTGETYVYMSPFVIMSVLIIYLVLYAFTEGYQGLLYLFADVIVNIIPYYIVLSIAIHFLRKYISARACSILWLFPLFLFYHPHILIENSTLPFVSFYIPEEFLQTFFYVWLIGAMIVLLWKCVGHLHFRKHILRNAEPITDMEVLSIWLSEYEESNYKQRVSLFYSKNAKTPLSMGIFADTRVVVLPYKEYSEEELHFVFRHEIIHLMRLDIDSKIALTLYQAIGWFNPLTWFAVRKANEDIELSCDELILKDCDEQQRKMYANLLLRTAGDSRGFTTCLSVDAKALRYRLRNVVNRRNVYRGTVVIGVIFFLFYMSYGFVAFTTGRKTIGDVLDAKNDILEGTTVRFEARKRDGYSIDDPEAKRIKEYILNLEVEKYVGVNQLKEKDGTGWMHIYGIYAGEDYRGEISIGEHLFVIDCWDEPTEYYIIKSDMDWDYLMTELFVKEGLL